MTLSDILHHKHIQLVKRGNVAIYGALLIAKAKGYTKVVVPDQGGWLTYKEYPKKLGMELLVVRTDNGLIIEEELSKFKDAVLLYQTIAGYFAEQDVDMIYKVAKENNLFLIEDVTASIGLLQTKADVAVCSFGKWKPVNLGQGGAISYDEDYGAFLKDFAAHNEFEGSEPELEKKIKELPKRYKNLFSEVEKIKSDLKDFEIIHKDKRGLVVVVAFDTEEQKVNIIKYCEKHHLAYTECPRYIRTNRAAICIEVKRKDI